MLIGDNGMDAKVTFSIGDEVTTEYGDGIIRKLWDNKIHTVEITKWSGVGYPAKLVGVYEGGMKHKDATPKNLPTSEDDTEFAMYIISFGIGIFICAIMYLVGR